MSFTVRLPWPPHELSPNYHGKLRHKLRTRKGYRDQVTYLAMEAKLRSPCDEGKIALKLEFYPPDRRERDDDNLVSSFKHGRDGLAIALRIDDKRFRTVPTFHDEVVRGGAIIVTLEAL